jgi:hypothetical protein
MRKHGLWFTLLACAVLLTGCSSSPSPVGTGASQPPPERLNDTIDISLADLLAKPRAELAALAEEWATKIEIQHQGHREGKLPFRLLPDLRPPLAVPVLRAATFSAKAGFSLPPYVAEDSRDSALALHLARFGDTEAAAKLVEQGDAAARRQIEAGRCERNYPLEWTRLVGLILHAAEFRLATGDVEGASELVLLHGQLRTLLDAKAAEGALGATLLPRGRETLARAAVAWRAAKKTELAEEVEAAVASWGQAPELVLGVRRGTPQAEVRRLLRTTGEGRAVPAVSTARAFDLFALPFPDEGAEGVTACFDEAGRLTEICVTYRAGLGQSFPEPAQLAQLLEERPWPGHDGPASPGLRRRTYALGANAAAAAWACEVLIVAQGAGVGAAVRFQDGKVAGTPSLPRAFGDAHFDRSFEQNRFRLAPEQRKETLTLTQPKALARLKNPLPDLKPVQAAVQREANGNLLARVVLSYATDESGPPPLHRIALPLWAAFGPARWEGVSDDSSGHLALTWEDAQTRYTLQLPYSNNRPPELEARDVQGPQKVAAREARAAAFDRDERNSRVEAGTALSRIPRQLEQFELGVRRAQVLQVLPPGKSILKQEFPGGLTLTFTADPRRTETSVARQMFFRFDKQDRVIELRARYVDGPAARDSAGWTAELLKSFTKRCGAPASAPTSWADLWSDLPPRKPAPFLHRWQDDLSELIYERDNGGVEVRLRDLKSAASLPALEYLARGPESCLLGMTRDEILRKWNLVQPDTTPDGAVILAPPTGGAYDVVLAWFEKDRAIRIVARHSPAAGNRPPTAAAMGQALTQAWGRELRTLGWPRRQDFTPHDVLQSLSWHDDRTRVRLFWQDSDTGLPRLFTEWKDLTGP